MVGEANAGPVYCSAEAIERAPQAMTKQALLDLAIRAEQAEGADFDLDQAVLLHVRGIGFPRPPTGGAAPIPSGSVPPFSASIDATMTLYVPLRERWPSLQMGTTDDGVAYAALAGNDGHMMAEDTDELWVEGNAPVLANALLAAILRAIAADREDG